MKSSYFQTHRSKRGGPRPDPRGGRQELLAAMPLVAVLGGADLGEDANASFEEDCHYVLDLAAMRCAVGTRSATFDARYSELNNAAVSASLSIFADARPPPTRRRQVGAVHARQRQVAAAAARGDAGEGRLGAAGEKRRGRPGSWANCSLLSLY